jgi:phage shock protein PspC (stress-responsive transcriptional regulator)
VLNLVVNMVMWRPSTLKIIVSFIAGLLGGAWGVLKAFRKYLEYQGIPGLADDYSLWEVVVRNGYLTGSIIGFAVVLVVAYVVYSLIQNKSETIMD